MKKYFDELSQEISKITTEKYSTSFSLGILALKPNIRPAIYSIYGFVRLADEIVDSFHDFDKETLLDQLIVDTYTAIENRISINPIINSFQIAVNKYDIDLILIDQFIKSMKMDLRDIEYNSHAYKEYIYGSAEVVGLMCLQVFTEGNKILYEQLKPSATMLGSAFQKLNFLRDVKDDYHMLGRNYFPNVDLLNFSNDDKLKIEQEIQQEFDIALVGIKNLPVSSKFGVYLAYRYYLSLFKKIKKQSSQTIMEKRIRVNNTEKAFVAFKSYLRCKLTYL